MAGEHLRRQPGQPLVHGGNTGPEADPVAGDGFQHRDRIEAAQQDHEVARPQGLADQARARPVVHGHGHQHHVALDLRAAFGHRAGIFQQRRRVRAASRRGHALGQARRAGGVDDQGGIAPGLAGDGRGRQQLRIRQEPLGGLVDGHGQLEGQPVEGRPQGRRVRIVADHHRGPAVGQHIVHLRRSQPPVQSEDGAADLGRRGGDDGPFRADVQAGDDDVVRPHAPADQALGDGVRRPVPLGEGEGPVVLDDRRRVRSARGPVLEAAGGRIAHAARLRRRLARKASRRASIRRPSGSASHWAMVPRRPARISTASLGTSRSARMRPCSIP